MSYSIILQSQKNLKQTPDFFIRKKMQNHVSKTSEVQVNWASQRFVRKFASKASKALFFFKKPYSYMVHTFKPQNTAARD